MTNLVRISCADIDVGMYVAEIEGSWWDSPFLRRSFPIKSVREIERLREAGIAEVTIDTSRGKGPVRKVEAEPVPPPPPPRPAPASRAKVVRQRVAEPEIERATATMKRSKAAVTRMFEDVRLGRAVSPQQVAPLVEEIAESVARDPGALIGVTRLKKKNEYTYLHSVAVCALMINLGRAMEMDEAVLQELGLAGLLHDIGKMRVPDAVLNKPGALTDGEFAVMRDHTRLGHELLEGSEGLSSTVLDVCLHHHERVDGTGYPFGLTADQLTMQARMGAVCDVYDAVTSARCYKASWSPGQALSRMLAWEGHFDPLVLDSFIASIGIFPVGALVRLRTNRLAVVTGTDDAAPTMPHVRAFYATVDREFMRLEDLRVTDDLRGDAIVGLEEGERWFGDRWPIVLAHVMRNQAPPPESNALARALVRTL